VRRERRIVAGAGADHQHVDEQADQPVERLVGAAGDRATDRQVGAGAEPREQRGQRRVQDHEHRRAGVAGEPDDPRVQLRRQREPEHVAGVAGAIRTRPVGRQRDLVG
jgi:hypothetical protein